MRIRTLLSVSHALVIGLFILAFLFTFFTLTKPPGPPPGPRSFDSLATLLKETTDPQVLRTRLEAMGYRDMVSLDLYDAEGKQTRMVGPDKQVNEPAFGDGLRRDGKLLEQHGPEGLHINWFPVDLTGPNSHLVRLEEKRDRDKFFQHVRQNVLIACAVAFLAALAIAIPMARRLAEPMHELASVVDRFGREGYELRSSVRGNAEIVNLSRSFNGMAEYIEANTNALREQKEKAERTEALRRQFLSDVSHNLRTPLTAIMGWNDALIEGVAEDEALYRSRIRREVQHVTKTVQRLLELSRWERAEPVLLKTDVPLGELLLEVAENLQEVAEVAQVSLAFEGLSSELSIYADRQKARDVFQILLENVVEHAGTGVHATVIVDATDQERLNVRIEDDGKGLPDTFQADLDMERGASEVGRACLGLAIASRLVKAHGGELKMSNRPGGGTVATLSFSRAPAEG